MLGTIMSYMGILVYALITGTKNIFSVLDMFLAYGLVALLPLIFVVIGFYMILLGLGIIKEKKDIKKTTFELEQEELKKQVLDAKIDEIEEVVEQVYIRTIKFTQFIPLIFLSIGLLFLAIKAPSLMFKIIVGLTWLTILFIYLPYFIELKRSKDKNVTPKIKKKRQKIDKAVSYLPFVPIILIFIITIVWQIYSS